MTRRVVRNFRPWLPMPLHLPESRVSDSHAPHKPSQGWVSDSHAPHKPSQGFLIRTPHINQGLCGACESETLDSGRCNACEGLQNLSLVGTNGLWIGKDIYRATLLWLETSFFQSHVIENIPEGPSLNRKWKLHW